MDKDTDIQINLHQVDPPKDKWFKTRINGTECDHIKAFLLSLAPTNAFKGMLEGSMFLLISQTVKHLAECVNKKWVHMTKEKLDEGLSRAESLKTFIQNQVSAFGTPPANAQPTRASTSSTRKSSSMNITPGYSGDTESDGGDHSDTPTLGQSSAHIDQPQESSLLL